MKFGLAFLTVLILVGLVFAVEPCIDCADFVNAPNGRLFTVTNSEALTVNIFAYYEDSTASPSRVPINNTILIIEISNSSGLEPEIYKVYTDNSGQATFDFTTWAQACVDMKILYCPFCANESANCGFAECMTFSGLHSEAGYYHNVPPGEEILNASSIPDGPGSIPKPPVLNDGKFLPDVTVSNYCAPPSTYIATPAMCLPLIIIFALLGGALYLGGQNPFGVFNLGSPRMGKHIRYQAKGRGFSLNLMSIAQAVSSVAGTVKQVKAAKAESAKAAAKGEKNPDGTPKQALTTAQAYRQVGNQTAANSVFLVSGLSNMGKTLQSRSQAHQATGAKGTKEGQALRAAKLQEGSSGSRGVEMVGGVQRSGGGLETRNTGAGLMQKWGGGESFGGNLAAGLTTISLGLVMNIPIVQFLCSTVYLTSVIATGKEVIINPMELIERAGVKQVVDAQANVKAQEDANGRLPVTTTQGIEVAIEKVEPGKVEIPKVDETGKPVLDASGKPVMIAVPDPNSTVVTITPPAKEEPKPVEAPKAGEAPKAEGEKQKVPEPPAGPAKVDVKMDNSTGQVTGVSYDAPPTKDASGKEVQGARVNAELAPDGSTHISVTPPPGSSDKPQDYTIKSDGTVTADGTKITNPEKVEAIKAMAAPAINGDNVSFKVGETPKMPTDWKGEIPILSKLTGADQTNTFLGVCQEKVIQYQEAQEKLSDASAAHGGAAYVKLGESLVDTPEGKERVKAAATTDAVNAFALALGEPVETPGASKAVNKAEGEAALATTKALGEAVTNADLFRGGFGERAAESGWAAINPNPSDDSRAAIRATGAVIDDLVRATPLEKLATMNSTHVETAARPAITEAISRNVVSENPEFARLVQNPAYQAIMQLPPGERQLPSDMAKTQSEMQTQIQLRTDAVIGGISSHAASDISSAARDLRAGMIDHMGADAVKQLERVSPQQFAQLCGSAVLIHNATEGDASSAAALVLRSNPETLKLSPEQKVLVAEYAAAEVARGMSSRVGYDGSYRPDTDMAAAAFPTSFSAADRTASERAQAASTHAIEIAAYQFQRSQADSVDDEHRKALPKEFEPVMKAHADAIDNLAQANLAQLRLERAGLLDPLGTRTHEGTLDVQHQEQIIKGQVREGLGYGLHERDGFAGGVSTDTGPVSVGKVKVFDQDPTKVDYQATAAILAERSQTYSIAGDQTSAEMYREALFSLTKAREADEQFHTAEMSGDTKAMRKQERVRDQQLTQVETRLAPPEVVETYTNETLIGIEHARTEGTTALKAARGKAEKFAEKVSGAVSRQIIDDDGAERPFH